MEKDSIDRGLDTARSSLVQAVRGLQDARELDLAGEAFALLHRVVRAQGARLRALRRETPKAGATR